MTGGKLVVQYALTERLAEGIKIIDLPANTVKVLKHLAQLNHVWTLPKFTVLLDKCGIPASKEALQKFIEDTDDGGVKRFPTFAGIDDIAWQDLHHAYGAATDVPELLRLLSSLNSESHGYALEALNSTILHQGSVFPGTYLNNIFPPDHALTRARSHALCRAVLARDARVRDRARQG